MQARELQYGEGAAAEPVAERGARGRTLHTVAKPNQDRAQLAVAAARVVKGAIGQVAAGGAAASAQQQRKMQ